MSRRLTTGIRVAAAAAAMLAILVPAEAGAYYNHPGKLLAPLGSCAGQTDVTALKADQAKAMLCLHRYARRRYHKLTGLHENLISRNPKLNRSSHKKLHDITNCQRGDPYPPQELSHTACGRKDSSGNPDPYFWFRKVGYITANNCSEAGENIGAGYKQDSGANTGTARAVFRAWLAGRQGQQANVLHGRYYDIGIALYQGNFLGNDSSQVWVVHYGDHC